MQCSALNCYSLRTSAAPISLQSHKMAAIIRWTFDRERGNLASPDTPFHPGSRCSSSQGGLAFQSCSGIRTRPPLCQQKRQTTYLTSPSASNRYSPRTWAGLISLHSHKMAAIIRWTFDRERGNLASPDTPFHPGSRCSSSQGGLAFQSCSGIRTRPPLCQQKKADHLPDLTLSFEPLQSTDMSRSHQPALT